MSDQPVTAAAYWAALDALAKACALEDEKYQAIVRGEPGARESMAAWWRVAEPRWRELEALLRRAEGEDWVRAMIRWDLWRCARRAGKPVGTVDATGPWPPAVSAQALLETRRAATAPKRVGATESDDRGVGRTGGLATAPDAPSVADQAVSGDLFGGAG